ncbi:MAG: PAS domain-containing protein [Anaeromyxobacteraceae bacterium]|nr:PAS domain-containing protein [Anaeromyxobacteraceae bacterium]
MQLRELRRGWRPEWWIPATYLVLSGAWIYGSDALVAAVAGSVERARVISTWKGLGFVLVTGLLLHLGLRLTFRRERAAARRLREGEALLRALTDAIPEPVFLKGLDGRWIFANPATLEVIGRTMDEVLGRTDEEIYGDRELALALMATDRRVMSTGLSEVVEEQVPGPLGTRTFLSTKAPYRDPEGRVVGLVGNARDITDRKRAERELLAAEERYQQAQRLESVGRLAGGVAHDFNNLLTVILGSSEALDEDLREGRPPSRDDVAQIRAAGERARELTGQLLAFARRQVVAPVPLDLSAAVRGSERLLRRVLGEDVALEVAPAEGLWTVRCDPGQVEQLILNLTINARDAMPRGGRLRLATDNLAVDEAQAALDPALRAGDWVRLSVQDSGEGMPPEVRAHLFEPFFTTKPKGAGTGLGLATVHGIVSQAGGFIRVHSAAGQGTTFELHLPRVAGAAGERMAAPAASPLRAARGSEVVLAVEDHPLVRDVTARALRGAGYQVVVAADGVAALEAAARLACPLHLLVTDVVMPGMDGRALADELRRRHPGLRVLFVSGYTQDVISHHGVLDAGVELLAKPFTAAALLARVRAVLDAPG